MEQNTVMSGGLFLTLFEYIYEFGGKKSLEAVHKSAGLMPLSAYSSENLYPKADWDKLIEATCSHLNTSKRRLEIVAFNAEKRAAQNEAILNGTHHCPLPFTQLCMNNDGTINPCGGLHHPLGNINEQSLHEIWNGEKAKEFRESILDGSYKFCGKVKENFSCNLYNEPLKVNESFELSAEPRHGIKRLDLDLNAKCNLECIMCDSWKGDNGTYTDENFWIDARKNIFPHLDEVAFKGGEPMIQADTYKFFDEVSAVNPKVKWKITTNGQYKINKRIENYLKTINLDTITVSLDSLIPEVYSQVRLKGNLEVSLKTVEDIIRINCELPYERRFQVGVNMLISTYTWKEVPAFYEYCNERRITFTPEILLFPEEMSIWKFEEKQIEEIFSFYLESNKKLLSHHFFLIITKLYQSFSPAIKMKHASAFTKQREEIKARLKGIDPDTETRNYSPETAEEMAV